MAATATPVPVGSDIQAQPAVIATGSADAPIGPPSHDAPSRPLAAPPSRPAPRVTFEAPIVVSSHNVATTSDRPTVTQLTSGGPLIAASGTAVAGAVSHPRPAPTIQPARPLALLPMPGTLERAVAPLVAVSVPSIGVYIGSETNVHHVGTRSLTSPAEPVGPSGLAGASISTAPFGSGWLGQSGASLLFGSTPLSSSGGTSAPLLGLNALLATMTLVAGMAWRRRSWDLPALAADSALLASALDRPG